MSKDTNDKLIKQLMDKVEEQKKSLGTRKKHVLSTNGIFKYYPDTYKMGTGHFNINTVSDPLVFVNALAFLLGSESTFKDACDRLGIKDADWKWNDYTVQDWEDDFKARIDQIQYDVKKKKLEQTQEKLNTLVSEEARTEMELDNIQKTLGL